jgi:hypothetical protein
VFACVPTAPSPREHVKCVCVCVCVCVLCVCVYVCVAGYKEIYLQVKRSSVCVWPLLVMGCLRAYLLCNTEHRVCVLDVQCGCVCETIILLKNQNLLVQLTGPIHLSYSLVVFTCPIHLP